MPEVTVIIPVYNVEDYLGECLDSVLAQNLEDIEIIVINDGSTDSSPDICNEYCQRHPGIVLVNQRNQGLGHARNVGVAKSTGKYLFFLDSDDKLPEKALSLMVDAANTHDADIVAGIASKFSRASSSRMPLPLFNRILGQERLRETHIMKEPLLIYDTMAWNKLYRSQWWKNCGLLFPAGVFYEDIAVIAKAHILSRKTVLLNEVVYLWRIRDSGDPSITQQKGRLKNLEDRMASVYAVKELLAHHDLRELNKYHNDKILDRDFWWHLIELPYSEPEYQNYYFKEVRRVLTHIPKVTLAHLGAKKALSYWLISKNMESVVMRYSPFSRRRYLRIFSIFLSLFFRNPIAVVYYCSARLLRKLPFRSRRLRPELIS